MASAASPLFRSLSTGPEEPAPAQNRIAERWPKLIKTLDDSFKRQGSMIPETDVMRKHQRSQVLLAALESKGLQLRFDSHLCAAWIKGQVDATAEEVAEVMAGMRYLHEYCKGFDKVCKAVENDIEVRVRDLARKNGRFYQGIQGDATEQIYGTGIRHFIAVRRGICQTWSEWPDEWPWLVDLREAAGEGADISDDGDVSDGEGGRGGQPPAAPTARV